ncbi:hypothetical protein BC827DRAFT_316132 [Russula dissimulans]|nr:hypothetical protein BC827DRAFT_316132 [Russula dissimulans]
MNAEFVVFVPSRTQGVIMDPNYPVGHPTSAARLAQPPWGPPPWADGTHPVPPYPIPGPPPAYYAPYYHPGMPPPPPPLANAQLHPNTPSHLYAPPSNNSPDDETGSPSDGEAETTTSSKRPQEAEVDHEPRPPESSAPVIDPSLEASDTYSNGKSPVSLAITSAAVQAVFNESRRIKEQRTESSVPARDSSVSSEPSPGGNPPSTMLTEDGETMLHPAELLTQAREILP